MKDWRIANADPHRGGKITQYRSNKSGKPLVISVLRRIETRINEVKTGVCEGSEGAEFG
jgi:hypothetical protein